MARGHIILRNCYATGDINVTVGPTGSTTEGDINMGVGGLVGMANWMNFVGSSRSLTIENCYSIGDIILNGASRTSWSASAVNIVGGVFHAGGLVGGASRGTITIRNSAALGSKTLAIPDSASNETKCFAARLFAGDVSTTASSYPKVYENNFALTSMCVGSDPNAPAPNVPGDAATNTGLSKTLAEFKQPATWKTGLGWSEAIWDFDGLTKTGSAFYWPRLK
jgi:hypothetical protein